MTSPKFARAIMASRQEPEDSKEYFPTPSWATRALCEKLQYLGYHPQNSNVWEPACGEGHMVRPLREYFKTVWASDIEGYGWQGLEALFDFLVLQPGQMFSKLPAFITGDVDWVITNPPFGPAEQFLQAALSIAKLGVALFLPLRWLEGEGRYARIFGPEGTQPSYVCQFAERVPIHKGAVKKDATTATAYAWFIWLTDATAPKHQLSPIAPCRARFDRDEDYGPVHATSALPLLGEEVQVTC